LTILLSMYTLPSVISSRPAMTHQNQEFPVLNFQIYLAYRRDLFVIHLGQIFKQYFSHVLYPIMY